jgi:hypothetical protein
VDDNSTRIAKLEQKMDAIEPLLEYVKTKRQSEEEWHQFICDLRLRVASGGALAVITAIALLIGWGVQHWIRSLIH